MKASVVVAGVSTRAAAASAADAGFVVTAVDAFADLDQHANVQAHRVRGRFSARAAAAMAATLPGDAAAYLSNFENDPAAVAAIAADRTLWGNAPEVLQRVRDPYLVAQALSRRGLPSPRLGGDVSGRWLLKPRASGGGHGIREWQRGPRVRRNCYVQEFVEGIPASIAFVANGREAAVIGLSRQLAGVPALGASGFQYCGNVIDQALSSSSELGKAARAVVHALTEDFHLVGVNGVDVIIQHGVPFVIEVNPRWSASMELIEQALGTPLFALHAAACVDRRLPRTGYEHSMPGPARGKAIVYARHDAVAGDTHLWLADGSVRDIPRPGVRIKARQPVCTVFAEGADVATCVAAIEHRAGRIHAELSAWQGALVS